MRVSELRAALLGKISLRRIWDGGMIPTDLDSLVRSAVPPLVC